MSVMKWVPSARGTSGVISILGTELNAIANDAGVLTSAIENATSLDRYADLVLVATFASAPVADRTVDVYVVRTVDGTNFEDATASRPSPEFAGSFVLDASASAQRKIVRGVLLPAKDFKLLLVNKSGVAFTATGHTLSGFFYNEQVV